jgi:hypothetical protein
MIKKRVPFMKTDRIIGFNEGTIDGIFESRKAKYEKWADFTFENNLDGTPESVFQNFKIFLATLPPAL